MSTSTANSRRHLRYRHPGQQIYRLVIEEDGGRQEHLNALVIDESHSGFACVIVGPPAGPNVRFYHQENEKVRTSIELRHQRQLAEDVQFLGFERTDKVTYTDEA